MSLTSEDKEFLIRALAMHAVITRIPISEKPIEIQADLIACWIGEFSGQSHGLGAYTLEAFRQRESTREPPPDSDRIKP